MFALGLLSLASVSALVFSPKIRSFLFSFIPIEQPSDLSSKFDTAVDTVKEIYKNASWKTLFEFSIFKSRSFFSRHLESGLLMRPKANFCDLVYYDGINRYVIRFPRVRGPSQIISILDKDDKDVTLKVKAFMGPSHNFHGVPTTPELLGYDILTFIFLDDTKKTFEKDQRIVF